MEKIAAASILLALLTLLYCAFHSTLSKHDDDDWYNNWRK